MPKYIVKAELNRPYYLTFRVEADDKEDAREKAYDLLDDYTYPTHVEAFPELIERYDAGFADPDNADLDIEEAPSTS